MSNFWTPLDFPLINCETELDLSCSKDCVISEKWRTLVLAANPNANPPVQSTAATQTTSASFQITSSRLCVPVVTLSINGNIKFFKNTKQEFKTKILGTNIVLKLQHSQKATTYIKWLIQYLGISIDCLSFHLKMRDSNPNPKRDSFDTHYILLVEIKYFNALIDNKTFFDQPIKKTRCVWKTWRNVGKW